MIIDTHAHLNMEEFQHDLDDVILRAKQLGVEKIIVVGMDRKHNERGIKLAHQYDNLYASIGVHPVDVKLDELPTIEPLLKHKKVVAIGETGIDLYWNKDNLADQIKAFDYQIKLAIKYQLPIIIHTRESFKEAYETIKPYKGQIKGVFHAFGNTIDDAKKVIDLGFMIGIGGVLTFKKSTDLQALVKEIDLKHIIVETDSPFLTPIPFRGKRNEPGYTRYVVEKIAEIKVISVDEVINITSRNANNLFGLERNVWKNCYHLS